MCRELTKEAYEADTHQPIEIGTVPTPRTWYGVVGTENLRVPG